MAAFFFRALAALIDGLKISNFCFFVVGKRLASARAFASLGFARPWQSDFILLEPYIESKKMMKDVE